MLDINSFTVLNNGVKMPWLGFGTYKIEYEESSVDYIKTALKVGYRHLDTAAVYGNEPIVGKAVKESGIPRNEIFITSKVWNNKHGYDKTLKAFEDTLKRLDTDYLDLYLIHWPKTLNKETWKALEKLYKDGRVRAIGVSNFKVHHLEEILEDCEIVPMVNQVEYHPQFPQTEVHEFCKKNKIQLESWGPLMQGKIFDIPLMKELSLKYGKTISQIALRWDLQMGVVTIPKSINENRIKENCDLYDFEISKEDMKKIESLNTGVRIGHDPDTITF
ncbi:diketogulonate reductase-like aldo/keto reductase [Clostridium acetobutylicum]|uniref:Predicted aldo/keto reductase, YTBE/YVGN B.subtilis ortholog n=1 Tax=Clostridium acetobutylicum (strain ATCC 824 / DSM 792 / JCM 1419 / IAM 19013 / LMG 5710 / NBRC 13948 / NRRL B-527 / VKM B-1787 / 2291 / W) TaxID=272562 RepID=Q97HQ1_CLOAB|nr:MULTISPECIES: aldo/keto reductase [Clostridium]AAK79919.1 Predicted aldo/keto reductase, YTBE/YVGN B.subtilis ortholog [Clostridium acetobutylicum ATCC 824]ADZ21012.1 aldo/keto reductase [Clostridium acetobutylicum EA 2018]AEI33319.1 aldo/keto reductase [Clostridium acetobutylicum DSM 1731]AWV79648.1 aldo/keto reductase [Clostridium acetobutylicum]MBC2394378.1 aldo/keto reductase [Clostridium acetobutylicum]